MPLLSSSSLLFYPYLPLLVQKSHRHGCWSLVLLRDAATNDLGKEEEDEEDVLPTRPDESTL